MWSLIQEANHQLNIQLARDKNEAIKNTVWWVEILAPAYLDVIFRYTGSGRVRRAFNMTQISSILKLSVFIISDNLTDVF